MPSSTLHFHGTNDGIGVVLCRHECGWGTLPASVAIAFLLLGIEVSAAAPHKAHLNDIWRGSVYCRKCDTYR